MDMHTLQFLTPTQPGNPTWNCILAWFTNPHIGIRVAHGIGISEFQDSGISGITLTLVVEMEFPNARIRKIPVSRNGISESQDLGISSFTLTLGRGNEISEFQDTENSGFTLTLVVEMGFPNSRIREFPVSR